MLLQNLKQPTQNYVRTNPEIVSNLPIEPSFGISNSDHKCIIIVIIVVVIVIIVVIIIVIIIIINTINYINYNLGTNKSQRH